MVNAGGSPATAGLRLGWRPAAGVCRGEATFQPGGQQRRTAAQRGRVCAASRHGNSDIGLSLSRLESRHRKAAKSGSQATAHQVTRRIPALFATGVNQVHNSGAARQATFNATVLTLNHSD